MTFKSHDSAADQKKDEKHGPARGVRGTDQRQGDLHDVKGGTFDQERLPEKDPLPRGLEHREGPLNKTSGRAPPNVKPKA